MAEGFEHKDVVIVSEDPRIQGLREFKGLFSNDFVNAFNMLSISAISSFICEVKPYLSLFGNLAVIP